MQLLDDLQYIVSIGFFICIGLYISLLFLKIGKKKAVDFQLWAVVAVGLLLSLAGQALGLLRGAYTWSQVDLTIYTSSILLALSLWTLHKKRWRREDQNKAKPKGKAGKGTAAPNKSKHKKGAKHKSET